MPRIILLLLAAGLVLPGCDADCDDLQREARELRASYARCEAGDTCVQVNMYEMAGENNCLLTLQCHHALNAAADLEAFRAEARRIARDYDGCPECAMASCVDPETREARCDVEQGRCVTVDREVIQ